MKAKLTPAKRIFIASITTLLAMFVVAGSLLLFGYLDDMIESRIITFIVNIFVAIINISILSFLLRKLDGADIRDLGFKIDRRGLVFVTVAFALTVILIVSYVGLLINFGLISGIFNKGLLSELNFYLLVVGSYLGWIVAASHEEVLTRGYFMKNLSHRKIISVLLISSFLFTIIHIPFRGVNPFMLVTWFLGGISYAYLYLKSGSLTISTLVHAIHNLTNDLAFYNIESFSLFSLGENLTSIYKGIYELLLCVVIVLLTYMFYGKNGFFTPASHLKNFWAKKNKIDIDTEESTNLPI
ncbi:CPBP family intramembrane glutamic endopeptidase [Bacillus sp. AK128]